MTDGEIREIEERLNKAMIGDGRCSVCDAPIIAKSGKLCEAHIGFTLFSDHRDDDIAALLAALKERDAEVKRLGNEACRAMHEIGHIAQRGIERKDTDTPYGPLSNIWECVGRFLQKAVEGEAKE